MLLVVADTGPLRYLIEIGHIEILPRLFQKILVPTLVFDELRHDSAPHLVKLWAKTPPDWVDVLPAMPMMILPSLPWMKVNEPRCLSVYRLVPI